MDVNEEIVKEYFELVENCIVRANIEYGKYHSAIDLLAIDKNGNIKDIEVKWKSRIVIEDSTSKQNGFKHIVNQLKDMRRNESIKELLGKEPTHKIFVTTKHFFSISNFDYWKNRFKEQNIEVLFFDDIIPKLVEKIKIKGKYESPVLQTIRM
ncbi:MAG: hypothetical protein ACE5KE_09430, partial [Methanosarcinales archaeon]